MYIRYAKYINKYNKSYDEERKKEIFYTFKLMARGWYSSCLIRFVFFFFWFAYFLSFGLLDCQFILNIAKLFIVVLYVFSNGFGKRKKIFGSIEPFKKGNWQINSNSGDSSYQLQSLMVLYLMVVEFLLQTMAISKRH